MDSEVMSILNKAGAWLSKGHYALVCGDHSSEYVNCRITLGDEEYRRTIGEHLARLFENDNIDLVVGILPSGALLAPLVASTLNAHWLLVRAERGSFRIFGETIRAPAKAILILDDVLTTDEPLRTLTHYLQEKNLGTIKSFGVIVDRSAGQFSPGVNFHALVSRPMDRYSPSDCPMCRDAEPLWDLGDPYADPLRQIISADDRQIDLLCKYYADVYEITHEPDRARAILRILEEATLEDAGHKEQRIAVLGAHETESLIHDTSVFVARKLGYYAITGKFIYFPSAADAVSFKHERFESMNDHLRKMVHGSRYVLAIHTVPSGEILETSWCSEAHKPTLGLAVFGRLFREPAPKCEYLRFYREQQYVRCNGIRALEDGSPNIGSWICKSLPSQDMCPFVKRDLPSMLLDLYCLNRSMILIGSYTLDNMWQAIGDFIKNNGTLTEPGGTDLKTPKNL